MIKIFNREIIFDKYPNGELMINFEKSDLMCLREGDHKVFPENQNEGKYVLFLEYIIEFKWEDDSDLIKLLIITNYLKDIIAKSNEGLDQLIIYSMPYARADRSENGSPFTLKYIADFINNLGFKKVSIVEPHSDVTLQLINNSEYIHVIEDMFHNVMVDIDFNPVSDYIVFPDRGSAIRYDKLKYEEEGFDTLFFSKQRDFETGEIKGLTPIGYDDMNFAGRKAIILDDMSSKGGTFYYVSKKLKEMGFIDIYLVVCHCEDTVFEGEIIKINSDITKIYTTDSMFTTKSTWQRKKSIDDGKLAVYKIEDLLGGNE